jgi:hypothetical protein
MEAQKKLYLSFQRKKIDSLTPQEQLTLLEDLTNYELQIND